MSLAVSYLPDYNGETAAGPLPPPHPVRQSGFREARADNATFFGKKLYKFKNDGIFHHDILIR
jgi:hypothetical protein